MAAAASGKKVATRQTQTTTVSADINVFYAFFSFSFYFSSCYCYYFWLLESHNGSVFARIVWPKQLRPLFFWAFGNTRFSYAILRDFHFSHTRVALRLCSCINYLWYTYTL